MGRQRIMLDFFSGSGSASQPFIDKGWKVYRYDINPQGADGIFTDLKEKMFVDNTIDAWKNRKVDLVWGSPPCTEYSEMNKKTNDPNFIPDTLLWKNLIRIIEEINPTYFVIENVRGAQRTWGPSVQNFGAYHLWGVYPKFNSPDQIPIKNIFQYSDKAVRARESAKIPYTIGKHLERAISLQEILNG
jgi:hypothetical protein